MSRKRREIERKILGLLHGHNTRIHVTQIHAHFLRHNLHHSNQILSHFVSVCASLHLFPYASRIFHHANNPNILLFNSIIKAFSLCPPSHPSFHFFSLMKSRAILPNEYTFAPLLKSSSNMCDYDIGQCVHAQVIRAGFEGYGSVRIGLVELYTTCERIWDAHKVFDPVFDRDVIVCNLMVRGFCKAGFWEMGFQLFRQMKERRVVSWNIVISCLAQDKKDVEALGLFHEMLELGFEPDDATLVTVLPVCARLGALDAGKWIHSYACDRGLQRDVVAVGNSLVDLYCKCGNLEAALGVFNEMPNKNVVSWNAMISGLAYNGKGELGVDLFQEMVEKGFSPSDSTLTSVLSCCAHAGLADRGLELFALVTDKFQMQPNLEHYGCVVDLLGRCGQVWEAHDLIRSMPMKPTAALWGSLLSACRTYGERKLAEIAVKELINLEPWNSGNYVLLSNIYAEEGKWDEVEKVRLLMRQNSIRKTPGQSATG